MARLAKNFRLPQVARRCASLVLMRLDLIAKRRWRWRRLIGPRDAAFSTLRPKLFSDLLRCGLPRFHSPFLTHYEALLKGTEQQSKLNRASDSTNSSFSYLVSCPRLALTRPLSAQRQALVFNLLQKHSRLDSTPHSCVPASSPAASVHTI